jgi:hypothetical protein
MGSCSRRWQLRQPPAPEFWNNPNFKKKEIQQQIKILFLNIIGRSVKMVLNGLNPFERKNSLLLSPLERILAASIVE